MGSAIAAVVVVVALAFWHLKTCRHANWKSSADARFYITSGYPLVAIAVYFLSTANSDTDWAWVLGNLWALIAMGAFVYGFNALNAERRPKYAPTASGRPDMPLPQDAQHRRLVTTGRITDEAAIPRPRRQAGG
jgi:hypothetical protein